MNDEETPETPPATGEEQPSTGAPGRDSWQRQALGWGAAAAVVSAILAVAANLSEIAGWFAPDETRELVEQTRGVIEGTDEKVEELLTLLRNQAAASGVDLNIESEAAIKNAIQAIVASGNAQKQAALQQLDRGDIAAAAESLSDVAARQASAVSETSEAAADSWREAGAIYYTFDVAQAVSSYEQANRLQPHDPPTLDMLGHSLNRAGRLADAEKTFDELLSLASLPADRSSAHFGLGAVAKQRGQYARAGEHFSAALEIAEANRLLNEQIYALIAIGQLGLSQGETRSSDERLRRALSLAEETGHEALQAKALAAIGTSAARQQRYGEAESLLRRALDLYESRNDKAGRALTLGNLGAVALSQGDVDVAETILLQTVALGEELGWQSSIAYDLVNLAAIAAARQDFDTADERLDRASRIADVVGLAELSPIIVFNRGEVARDRGDLETACRYWLQAQPVLVEMGSAHAATAKDQIGAANCGSFAIVGE